MKHLSLFQIKFTTNVAKNVSSERSSLFVIIFNPDLVLFISLLQEILSTLRIKAKCGNNFRHGQYFFESFKILYVLR